MEDILNLEAGLEEADRNRVMDATSEHHQQQTLPPEVKLIFIGFKLIIFFNVSVVCCFVWFCFLISRRRIKVSDSGSLMEHFLTLSSTLHHHMDHVPLPTALELPGTKQLTSGNTSGTPPGKGTTTSVSDNVDYVPIISGAFTAGKINHDRPGNMFNSHVAWKKSKKNKTDNVIFKISSIPFEF